ncbi:MAG: hypothetical protein A2017_01925 [Lentisphaerae bacterium GWF2_44_16]|nr:MAG: hypothetical protein A2017_01925 [Lentisphaerae bacterium GWF2_44_16]
MVSPGLQGVLWRSIESVKPFGVKGYRRFLESVTLGAGKKKWSSKFAITQTVLYLLIVCNKQLGKVKFLKTAFLVKSA